MNEKRHTHTFTAIVFFSSFFDALVHCRKRKMLTSDLKVSCLLMAHPQIEGESQQSCFEQQKKHFNDKIRHVIVYEKMREGVTKRCRCDKQM